MADAAPARMTITEAAAYLGVPAVMLERWALQETGPRSIGSPLHPEGLTFTKADLDAWMERHRHG